MERSTEISAAKIVLRHGKRQIINCSIVLLFFSACESKHTDIVQSLPYYNTADFTALWPAEDHLSIDSIHTIQAFSFTDQDNQTISNQSLQGKIYVVNFFFTSCGGICPKMIDNMKTVADTFKENGNIIFLSHSVTPEKDSVAVLKRYAELHDIKSSQWHLLTGSSTAINTIARRSYFIEKLPGLSEDSTEFLHTENMVLVDRKGHIRGLYKGTLAVDATRLIEDINILLKE
ncbi:MAG: SCO family protein [Ferruginibacter sp.]